MVTNLPQISPGSIATHLLALAAPRQYLNGYQTNLRIVTTNNGQLSIFDLSSDSFYDLCEWRETEGKAEESGNKSVQLCENSEIARIIRDKEESEKIAKVDLEAFQSMAAEGAYQNEMIIDIVVQDQSKSSYIMLALSNLGFLYCYNFSVTDKSILYMKLFSLQVVQSADKDKHMPV